MIPKTPVKGHYSIFHKSFDSEIVVWTPIQSRDSAIERYNLKYHKVPEWPPAADALHLCMQVKFQGVRKIAEQRLH